MNLYYYGMYLICSLPHGSAKNTKTNSLLSVILITGIMNHTFMNASILECHTVNCAVTNIQI